MEMILIGGVEVGAEDGELGFGEGGGLKRIKKKKKRHLVSVWVESALTSCLPRNNWRENMG